MGSEWSLAWSEYSKSVPQMNGSMEVQASELFPAVLHVSHGHLLGAQFPVEPWSPDGEAVPVVVN